MTVDQCSVDCPASWSFPSSGQAQTYCLVSRLGGDGAKKQTRAEKGASEGPLEKSSQECICQRECLSRGLNEDREGALWEHVPGTGDSQSKGPEAGNGHGAQCSWSRKAKGEWEPMTSEGRGPRSGLGFHLE